MFEENEGRKHGQCSLLDLPTVLEIKKKLCEANVSVPFVLSVLYKTSIEDH